MSATIGDGMTALALAGMILVPLAVVAAVRSSRRATTFATVGPSHN
jgi:hypothetical protein